MVICQIDEGALGRIKRVKNFMSSNLSTVLYKDSHIPCSVNLHMI